MAYWVPVPSSTVAMSTRCLPCYLIVRNLALLVLLVGGAVWGVVEAHGAAQVKEQQSQTLRRMVLLQVVLNQREANP